MRLPFKSEASITTGFHPISITTSPLEHKFREAETGDRIIRLMVVSYPSNVNDGVVEIIDYHHPPTSFLTNLFGIKQLERGGELSYVATIESELFTSPAGIVAVKDHASPPSAIDGHSIPSFYLTNAYRTKGLLRSILEKGLQIPRGDFVFYNALAQTVIRVGFDLHRPGPIASDDTDSMRRIYVATQDGQIHLFELPLSESVPPKS
jgi:hypothetical protein